MRQILFYILLIGLISCSEDSQEKQAVNLKPKESLDIQKTENKPKLEYQKIMLSENSLDTFSIPFPETNMLTALRGYYKPYWVEVNIGQQDGPDFTYIDILKDDDNPVAYINFDHNNKYKLDEIRIVSSTAIDQCGVRVGDTYQQVIDKRQNNFKNSTNYHQHTHLFADESNIFYKLTGDFNMSEEMLENIEELELTEEQLQKCKVENIVWRKRK